jgi:hypothetical protein
MSCALYRLYRQLPVVTMLLHDASHIAFRGAMLEAPRLIHLFLKSLMLKNLLNLEHGVHTTLVPVKAYEEIRASSVLSERG